MTPEAQRIGIAEACGWMKFFEPSGKDEGVGKWIWHKGNKNLRQPPDYLNDLNAMHEAEKVLIQRGSWHKYEDNLLEVCLRDSGQRRLSQIYTIHATAAQRAEAFLRTLGKWKE